MLNTLHSMMLYWPWLQGPGRRCTQFKSAILALQTLHNLAGSLQATFYSGRPASSRVDNILTVNASHYQSRWERTSLCYGTCDGPQAPLKREAGRTERQKLFCEGTPTGPTERDQPI